MQWKPGQIFIIRNIVICLEISQKKCINIARSWASALTPDRAKAQLQAILMY